MRVKRQTRVGEDKCNTLNQKGFYLRCGSVCVHPKKSLEDENELTWERVLGR